MRRHSLDIAFSPDVEESYSIVSGAVNKQKIIHIDPFAFLSQPIFQLLPPVTKYISPWGGDYNFILVEHLPYTMVYDSGERIYNINIPWSYTLIHVTKNSKKYYIHKFFRPQQVYSAEDKLYVPWMFDKTTSKNIQEVLDATVIGSNNELPMKRSIINCLDVAIDHFNNDKYISERLGDITKIAGSKPWRSAYQFDDDVDFMRSLEDSNQKYCVDFKEDVEGLNFITINDLHELSLEHAVEAIPTLRSLLEKDVSK